jgi:AcrR family transcriptional regulator
VDTLSIVGDDRTVATQTERRQATRSALLTAAVGSLLEHGVAGFTTADVVRRAGLSNGALFRYFPTKADLLAATVEHVFTRLRRDYEEAFESLAPGDRTVENLVGMLWGVMSDPDLAAAFEVYTAARTDAWMQSAIEPVMAEHLERLHDLARELVAQVSSADDETVRRAVDLAILSMQGLALNLMARPDVDAAGRLVTDLVALASAMLVPIEHPTEGSPT